MGKRLYLIQKETNTETDMLISVINSIRNGTGRTNALNCRTSLMRVPEKVNTNTTGPGKRLGPHRGG